MINKNADSTTTVTEPWENPVARSSAQSPEYFFTGKGVSPVAATTGANTLKSLKGPFTVNPATDCATRNVLAVVPCATTANSAVPITQHEVSSDKKLRVSDLDWRLEWSELDDKITKNLPAEMQILFAIYLGFPLKDIHQINEKVHAWQCTQHDCLSWSALHRNNKDGLIREKLTITNEKLLTMLAGISRFDLVDMHCNNFGIVFDQSRFPTQWPPAVKSVGADAVLDHPLDLFMLYPIFEKDGFLGRVPTERIAFAAGYPELMMDQKFHKFSMICGEWSTIVLLKKILDKQEGRMTTNELVKIMTHPEIMANRCAHQLIEALGKNSVPLNREYQIQLSLLQKLTPEQPSAIKPPYRPDDDSVAATPRSQPLTPDFLCRLPLSHNWFLIGFAMGISMEELLDIDQKTKEGKHKGPDQRCSLGACYLSVKLAELGKRGVETGHLFQVLHNLNDQVALRYFPQHLSATPEKALPEEIRKAIKLAKLTIEMFNTVDSEKLTTVLSGYDRFVQMEQEY